MRCPPAKQLWIGVLVVSVLLATVCLLPPVRTEFHKARVQSLKQKRLRLVTRGFSGLDKFWLHVTGTPISVPDLDAAIHKHEAALVKLGFLDRQSLPVDMVSACPRTVDTLKSLRRECPWYDSQTVSTNLLITACPGMMDRWRQRVKELGW